MSSGYGLKGGTGRCFDFWNDFSACMSKVDDVAECKDLRDDYFECLYHRKEYSRYNTVVLEAEDQAKRKAASGGAHGGH